MPAKKSARRRSQQAEGAEEPGSTRAKTSPAKRAVRRDPPHNEIGRAEIIGKYWELANLDPEVTKGTITGQLKALDSLCEELGLAPATQKGGEPPAAHGIYRSAWMRSASKTQDGE